MNKKEKKNQAQRSIQRARTAAGYWPVADPEPIVIDLLRRMLHVDDKLVMPVQARAELFDQIRSILAAWKDNEDINELREMLGLKPGRGRRRTQRTVNHEEAIAFAYAELQWRNTPHAREQVAEEFDTDVRMVDRACEKWGPKVEKEVKLMHELWPDTRINYPVWKQQDKK